MIIYFSIDELVKLAQKELKGRRVQFGGQEKGNLETIHKVEGIDGITLITDHSDPIDEIPSRISMIAGDDWLVIDTLSSDDRLSIFLDQGSKKAIALMVTEKTPSNYLGLIDPILGD